MQRNSLVLSNKPSTFFTQLPLLLKRDAWGAFSQLLVLCCLKSPSRTQLLKGFLQLFIFNYVFSVINVKCGSCMNWDNVTQTGMGHQYHHTAVQSQACPLRSVCVLLHSACSAAFSCQKNRIPSISMVLLQQSSKCWRSHTTYPQGLPLHFSTALSQKEPSEMTFPTPKYKVMRRDWTTPRMCVDDERLAGESGSDC